MTDSTTDKKVQVTILGGGIAALTAAYELSKTSQLRDQYELTVYQMGWRLGGKLASGTNAALHQRNEEHGLHIWFGFYDNAFANIKECYQELLKLHPDYRFQDYMQAFQPQSYTPIGQQIDGRASFWDITWPTNPGVPGDGGVLLTPWEYIVMAYNLLKEIISNLLKEENITSEKIMEAPEKVETLFQEAISQFKQERAIKREEERTPFDLLDNISHWLESFEGDYKKFSKIHFSGIWKWLDFLRKWVLPILLEKVGEDPDQHNLICTMDVGIAFFTGLFNPKYGIMEDLNLNRIDHLDFREFLIENGATPQIVNKWSALRAFYDTPFAYQKGDIQQPSYAAGVAVRVVIRICLTYKQAVLFLPQAGFGECVIGPYYEILKKRGVRFKFFHKVKKLKLTPNQNQVAQIIIERQTDIVEGEYTPVQYEGNLIRWPAEPYWEQLVNGSEMKEKKVNFESHWNAWPTAGELTLEQGVDFDQVVLGMALGAFKQLNEEDESICQELIEASPEFRKMTENLGLVPTLGAQLWFLKSLQQLGWEKKPASVGGPEPIDVWTDMSQVLETEAWQNVQNPPQSLQYLCGPLKTDLFEKPSSEITVPQQGKELSHGVLQDWLEKYAYADFPGATDGDDKIDWSTLYDEKEETGPTRLNAQYMRANIDPTECCIGSFQDTVNNTFAIYDAFCIG